MKNKFKVGDIVRGTKASDDVYNITNSNMTKAEVVKIPSNKTIIIKIIKHKNDLCISSTFKVNPYFFEKVKPETIVIYRKDRDVIALDKSTGEKAIARCNPADKFDFMTGAKLAFKRLTSTLELLNTKICITDIASTLNVCHLTVGKIYEVKDGKFTNNKGDIYPLSYSLHNIEELRMYLARNSQSKIGYYAQVSINFVEVVE